MNTTEKGAKWTSRNYAKDKVKIIKTDHDITHKTKDTRQRRGSNNRKIDVIFSYYQDDYIIV